MIDLITCTVCHQASEKLVSYVLVQNGGRITKLCCVDCKEKTHPKWIENGWVLVNETI